MFEDDMTFCSSECNKETCRRHPANMKIKNGIHSFSAFKGTLSCPNRERTVVLCGECSHWQEKTGYVGTCDVNGGALFRDNDFCSYGKKK